MFGHTGHEHALVGILQLGGGVPGKGRENVVQDDAGWGLVPL